MIKYKDCVVTGGDFNGFRWKEGSEIAEELFKKKHCYAILTASNKGVVSGYRSYVVDGAVRLKFSQKQLDALARAFKGDPLAVNLFKSMRTLVFHVNYGWGYGRLNGYYYSLKGNASKYTFDGSNQGESFARNVAYTILSSRS